MLFCILLLILYVIDRKALYLIFFFCATLLLVSIESRSSWIFYNFWDTPVLWTKEHLLSITLLPVFLYEFLLAYTKTKRNFFLYLYYFSKIIVVSGLAISYFIDFSFLPSVYLGFRSFFLFEILNICFNWLILL